MFVVKVAQRAVEERSITGKEFMISKMDLCEVRFYGWFLKTSINQNIAMSVVLVQNSQCEMIYILFWVELMKSIPIMKDDFENSQKLFDSKFGE